MKKLLAVIAIGIAVMAVFGARTAWAEVKFVAWNQAFFGGEVRLEGQSAEQKCSGRFDPKGTKKFFSSGGTYVETTARLSCDLADGGRLVIGVNKRPTGFKIPAGVITHGREPYLVVRNIPSVLVPVATMEVEGFDLTIEFTPQARGGACYMAVYAPKREGESWDDYRDRENSYLKDYLARQPLPCQRPSWYPKD